MWMFMVESIATEDNVKYEPNERIPNGVLREVNGELTTNDYTLHTEWKDAYELQTQIDKDAERFAEYGYGHQFFGYVTEVYIPLEEMHGWVETFGLDQVQAALDFEIGD